MKKILTLALVLVMTMSLIGCSSQNKTVATVNEQEITLGNYEKLLALNKSSMELYYGSEIWSTEIEEGKTYEDMLKDMVIETMIRSEVIYEQAKKEGVEPTEKEIQQQVDSFNEDTKDDTEYKDQLKKIGIDEEFLKFQFARDLSNSNLQEKFEDDTQISEEEMTKYYEDNKKDFYIDTTAASHILIRTQDDEGKELSDEKKKEAKLKAEEALEKVKNGEDFKDVAKEYSQDGSASSGGDLGTFGRGQIVAEFGAEFEEAAFGMKDGEISDIVETEYGYHIIKVTERTDKQQTYDEVKEKIKSTLASSKYNEYVEKLKEDSTIEQQEDIVKSAKF